MAPSRERDARDTGNCPDSAKTTCHITGWVPSLVPALLPRGPGLEASGFVPVKEKLANRWICTTVCSRGHGQERSVIITGLCEFSGIRLRMSVTPTNAIQRLCIC
jgi:hypothetical protein